MIEITNGNLLTSQVEALVNTVNTEGVMGKGIALQFKQAFPAMYKDYEAACKAGEVKLGHVHVYDLGGLVGGPRWIINFPTKGHWKSRSRLSDIEHGLDDLIEKMKCLDIQSIAVPPLGCGYGGLNWDEVRPLIERKFSKLPDRIVKLYPPNGAPEPKAMLNRTEKPEMNESRAALIVIMERYLQGLLDPFVSLLEIHKLMYFLQEAGQPLRLQYEAQTYGPYAKNLRHVLIKLEGHYLSGYGEGTDNPDKPIELLPGAVEEASGLVSASDETLSRMNRVTALISGFEDSYGLELLSSVHWVMCHDQAARDSADDAIEAVHRWNDRKKKTLKSDHLRKAWDRLKTQRWDQESLSAIH
jgi:O-acetyl-ADP-ribose deacetylase (regulator of RNase III)